MKKKKRTTKEEKLDKIIDSIEKAIARIEKECKCRVRYNVDSVKFN